jgi:hypothetical protein
MAVDALFGEHEESIAWRQKLTVLERIFMLLGPLLTLF